MNRRVYSANCFLGTRCNLLLIGPNKRGGTSQANLIHLEESGIDRYQASYITTTVFDPIADE